MPRGGIQSWRDVAPCKLSMECADGASTRLPQVLPLPVLHKLGHGRHDRLLRAGGAPARACTRRARGEHAARLRRACRVVRGEVVALHGHVAVPAKPAHTARCSAWSTCAGCHLACWRSHAWHRWPPAGRSHQRSACGGLSAALSRSLARSTDRLRMDRQIAGCMHGCMDSVADRVTAYSDTWHGMGLRARAPRRPALRACPRPHPRPREGKQAVPTLFAVGPRSACGNARRVGSVPSHGHHQSVTDATSASGLAPARICTRIALSALPRLHRESFLHTSASGLGAPLPHVHRNRPFT